MFYFSDNELNSIIKCALATFNLALLVLFVSEGMSTNWAKYNSHSHTALLNFSFDNIKKIFFEMTSRLRVFL